ncbi:MAG: serine hydrolase [Acidobacteria bacterium]|nr:serine hydrolase [Acidobacteriota bacterium]
MKQVIKFIIIGTLLILALSCEEQEPFISSGQYNGTYWPTNAWLSCSPEEVQVDSDALYRVYEYASTASFNTYGLIIIKDGYIIGEAYLNGYTENDRFTSYSVSKSFLSALIGIAIDEGYIDDIDDFAYKYFTEWQAEGIDPRKKFITIRHLLQMSSGILWNEDYNDEANSIMQMAESGDYLTFMLNQPMESNPGTIWEYNTGNSVLLSGLIQRTTGMNTFQYGMMKMFQTIGIPGIEWSEDETGLTTGGWGIHATLREYAKFGYLFINNGLWENEQVVPENWVRTSTTSISPNIPYYCLHWWRITGLDAYNLPSGVYAAKGIHGQLIYVIPDHNILAVKTGNDPDPIFQGWNEVEFISRILDSLQ